MLILKKKLKIDSKNKLVFREFNFDAYKAKINKNSGYENKKPKEDAMNPIFTRSNIAASFFRGIKPFIELPNKNLESNTYISMERCPSPEEKKSQH